MKRIGLLFAGLCILAVVLLLGTSRLHPLGGGVVPLGGDAKQLESYAWNFLEDLQFKNFQHAASFHSREDRKNADIPHLIERLFGIKPELLDITQIKVMRVELDHTGTRARVKCHAVVKILNSKEIRDVDLMLYFRKDPAEGWVMDLQSSLH